MTADELKAAVQQSMTLESGRDRHNAYPIRKPVSCVVCETPGVRGAMCDGCRAAWREGKAA